MTFLSHYGIIEGELVKIIVQCVTPQVKSILLCSDGVIFFFDYRVLEKIEEISRILLC